ncbi:MAG: hypothetical protein IKF82_00450 [Bacilli bacterium]|nr:hypothetical protein [Bacilli bacterium]
MVSSLIVNTILNMDDRKIKDMKQLCSIYKAWIREWCKDNDLSPKNFIPKLEIINLKQHNFNNQTLYIAHNMNYDGHNVISAYSFMCLVVNHLKAPTINEEKCNKFWMEKLNL